MILTAALVASLTAVATMGITRYLTDGKTRVAKADISTLKTAVRLYILDTGYDFTSAFTPSLLVSGGYLPELPVDPFSKSNLGYVLELRTDPSDSQAKIYIGSRGPNGNVDYGSDDIVVYVR